ncbi:DUF6308 family protein [Arthrobacter sp.]|uniref:DUF6308 family protein n=1 Tax=Arthrobacter sp. TaxID=1667 RepID=UPI00338FCDBB
MGPGSAVWKRWFVLRRTPDGRRGIGQSLASKIMARERPRLAEIRDRSGVATTCGTPTESERSARRCGRAVPSLSAGAP